MNNARVILSTVVVILAIGTALWWATSPKDFATPQQCVEAYRDALVIDNEARLLKCLAEPLRAEMEGQLRDAAFRRSVADLKGWTQLDPEIDGPKASIVVDEIRATETRRTRFRLEQSGQGWLIVGID